jgi:hypothetical protein
MPQPLFNQHASDGRHRQAEHVPHVADGYRGPNARYCVTNLAHLLDRESTPHCIYPQRQKFESVNGPTTSHNGDSVGDGSDP